MAPNAPRIALIAIAIALAGVATDASAYGDRFTGRDPNWWDRQRAAHPDCDAEIDWHEAAHQTLMKVRKQKPPDADEINAASKERRKAYEAFILCVHGYYRRDR